MCIANSVDNSFTKTLSDMSRDVENQITVDCAHIHAGLEKL